MARGKGQSASPSARPRKAKDTSILNAPGRKTGPVKDRTAVSGSRGSTGHK